MSPRTVRLAIVLTLGVGLLFAGRWTAGLLADRWWAQQISPRAAGFVTGWGLVRLSLDSLGVVSACAWFVGNLLVVYRAIGSVQIHRQVGNLDIPEAVNTRVLGAWSIASGLVLGLVAGQGVGDWTPQAVLALKALPYGENDPLLGQDVAFYVTRLPFWRLLHGQLLLLVALALVGTLVLYAVIGAVAWRDGRPAINNHARIHLGLLCALLALAVAWGYLLEPYEIVAGVGAQLYDGLFAYRALTAELLAGPALFAALASLLWVWRGLHGLMVAGWTVAVVASLLGHHVIPALIGGTGHLPLDPGGRRRLDQVAYGMAGIRDSVFSRWSGPVMPPRPVGLWPPALVPAALHDSASVIAFDRAVLPVGAHARAVWLVVHGAADGGAEVHILSDDQTTPLGHPLTIQDDDSLRARVGRLQLSLPPRAAWPGPREVVIDSTSQGGVMVGTGLRRIVLAWALQTGQLLGGVPSDSRVFWYLDPATRLAHLAPFASWGLAVPRMINGEMVWLSDGYVASEAFPGSARVRWRDDDIGSLRAAFVGVVHASGVTNIYLRHTADDLLGKSWQSIARGVVEPASAIPPEVSRAVPYPLELLGVQTRVLGQEYWGLGRVEGGGESVEPTGPRDDAIWEADSSGIQYITPFLRPPERQIAAILRARMTDGWETLRILRVDSIFSLPEPATLDNRWARFPSFQQLRDSVEKGGARLESAPVHYWITPEGLAAYQSHFAVGAGQEPALVWISLALGDRRGAGHDVDEAWHNLLGLSAPLISAAERGALLEEARRYLTAADAALKRGDLEAFARAFSALKRTLQPPPEPARQR